MGNPVYDVAKLLRIFLYSFIRNHDCRFFTKMQNNILCTFCLTAILCVSNSSALICYFHFYTSPNSTLQDCSLQNDTMVDQICTMVINNGTILEQGCVKFNEKGLCGYKQGTEAVCCCTTNFCNANADECYGLPTSASNNSSYQQQSTNGTATNNQQTPIPATTPSKQQESAPAIVISNQQQLKTIAISSSQQQPAANSSNLQQSTTPTTTTKPSSTNSILVDTTLIALIFCFNVIVLL